MSSYQVRRAPRTPPRPGRAERHRAVGRRRSRARARSRARLPDDARARPPARAAMLTRARARRLRRARGPTPKGEEFRKYLERAGSSTRGPRSSSASTRSLSALRTRSGIKRYMGAPTGVDVEALRTKPSRCVGARAPRALGAARAVGRGPRARGRRRRRRPPHPPSPLASRARSRRPLARRAAAAAEGDGRSFGRFDAAQHSAPGDCGRPGCSAPPATLLGARRRRSPRPPPIHRPVPPPRSCANPHAALVTGRRGRGLGPARHRAHGPKDARATSARRAARASPPLCGLELGALVRRAAAWAEVELADVEALERADARRVEHVRAREQRRPRGGAASRSSAAPAAAAPVAAHESAHADRALAVVPRARARAHALPLADRERARPARRPRRVGGAAPAPAPPASPAPRRRAAVRRKDGARHRHRVVALAEERVEQVLGDLDALEHAVRVYDETSRSKKRRRSSPSPPPPPPYRARRAARGARAARAPARARPPAAAPRSGGATPARPRT